MFGGLSRLDGFATLVCLVSMCPVYKVSMGRDVRSILSMSVMFLANISEGNLTLADFASA